MTEHAGPPRLAGKVVVVTGGARGIGAAIAEVAAREGAAVAILDVIDPTHGHGLPITADITDAAAIETAMGEVRRALGPIEVLVNNAGRNAYFDPVQMTEQQWDDVFAVDLKGAWLCVKHALPDMIGLGRGSIVNIASLHARLTCDGMFPYAAAKAGLVGLTRSLALEVGRHGIRVNAVSPGYIDTPLLDEYFAQCADPGRRDAVLRNHPMHRLGTSADVAEVVCFLASDAAAFVTGADWAVDGGLGARFASQ